MNLRQNEFYWLSSSNNKRSLGTILYWMTPVLVSSITFGAYILLGHRLSPSVVFTALSAFRIVQDPIRVVPELLAIIIQVTPLDISKCSAMLPECWMTSWPCIPVTIESMTKPSLHVSLQLHSSTLMTHLHIHP